MNHDSSTEDSVRTLKMNSVLYKQALDDLTSEELNRKPADHSNPMIWLAGHVLYSRCGLARYVGVQTDLPWSDLFKRYSQIQPGSAYPGLEEILSRWDSNNAAIKQRLSEMDNGALNGPGPWDLPVKVETIKSGITFMIWHESYHIGQMGYLRKWLGHEGLVG